MPCGIERARTAAMERTPLPSRCVRGENGPDFMTVGSEDFREATADMPSPHR